MKKFIKILILSLIIILPFRFAIEYYYQPLNFPSILFGIFTMFIVDLIRLEIKENK